MDSQTDMAELRRRLAAIQRRLEVDARTKKERVELRDLAHVLSDVFGLMDELAVAIEEIQSQV